jgi:SAM-dependent methyltransferase
MSARYDGLAAWYDEEFAPAPLESATWDSVERLLGPGDGTLVDVGCGTGAYAAALADLGWDVTGVDVSEDMLARARARGVRVVRADALALPFADSFFDAAVSLWTHTDVGDFGAALREIARVLRPEAPFVYVGAHPCFVGPHSEYIEAKGVPKLHPGWYRRSGPYDEAPGRSGAGLRARVGSSFHRPLAEFLQTFLDSELRLERIEEPEKRDYPYMLALRLRR